MGPNEVYFSLAFAKVVILINFANTLNYFFIMTLKLDGMKGVENVIFDLGNVILDIDIMFTIREFEKLGIDGLSIEDIHPHQKDFFLALELGTISDEEFIEKLHETYPSSKSVDNQLIWDAWNKLILEFDVRRLELLKKVAKKYNIYLLSNTNHPHRVYFLEKFIRDYGYNFESLFLKCYYSDEMKLRKPDPLIYSTLIDDAGIVAEKTLFIDDNYCNFSGAEAVGLKWYHLTGGETILDLFE